jgi:catechol 2,3-dioxygenase
MTPSLQLTAIRLRVADLARSVEFYVGRLGFAVHEKTGAQQVTLATGHGMPALLTLEEAADAPTAPRDAAGLFHAALLFPRAAGLGGWLRLAASHGVEFDGFSDHGVSEAIYFSDPDGNGLEFYADREAAQWPRDASGVAMTTRPLDVQRLLAEAMQPGAEPLAGAAWGHLHLRVTDLERSEQFYRQALGVEVTQRSYPGARFLAADGYHHHLGINTWGDPRQPRSPEALGLAEATFAKVGETKARALRDPDGIALRLVPAEVLARR